MLATRLRKVLTAVVALLLIALASPVLTPGTASADSTDSSGYFTYTSGGTSVTVTGCTELCIAASVSIPSTIEGLPVTSVTSGGFGSVHIPQLTIPNSVTTFNDIWQGGYNIDRIVFAPGSKITHITEFQFANNGNLRSIVLPDHLRSVGVYAFTNAGLDSITFPGTVTSLPSQSFTSNRFTTVTIPASVTSLAGDAFSGNVTKTFAPPAVSSVTYSLNGGSMPGGALLPTQADTTQNTTFTVGNGIEPVKAGYLFGGWSDGSASYPDGSSYSMGGSPVTLSALWLTVTWSYTINNGRVTVSGCTPSCPDAALTIPSTIEGLPVTSVTSGGFGSVHIPQLTIPNSVTTFNDIWQGGYNIDRIVFAPGSKITRLRDFLFANNGNLRSIVMPDHLKEIGQYTFYNAGLDSVTIPGTVTSIEGQSFQANRFSSVTIPASVTSLSSAAFDGNVSITYAPPATSSVTYDLDGGSMPGGASLPTQADALQNTSFTVGNGTNPVKDGYLFGGWSDGSATYGDGSPFPMGGSPVTLSAVWVTVTWTYEISNGAVNVSGCTPSCPDAALTIPSTIEGLPVRSLSYNNFENAPIAELRIPSSVSSWSGWSPSVKISRVVFAPNSKMMSINGFTNNGNLRSIVLPDHLRTISTYAFYNSGLDSITIPGTVTSIEGDSFKYNRFTSVTIPASVTSLSPYAFDGNVTKTFAPPATSSVTYDLDGGSMPGGASLPTQADTLQNTTFTVGNGTDPVKDGFQFGGWSDGSATFGDGAPYSMGGSPVTLTAMWVTVTWSYTINNGQVTVSGCTPSCPDAALTIPSTIEGLPVTTLDRTNFENAPIAELRIPSSVSSWSGWSPSVKISRMVFAPNSKMTTINGFVNNGNLRSIVLPDHLRTISSYAFYNAGLDSITIPGTVTSIEGDSFPYNRFTSVTIPASVTSLHPQAFSGNVTKTFADPVLSSVTYSLNGGSMPGGATVPTQADTLENTTFTVGNGTDPVRAGYGFGGWSDYWGTIYGNGDSFLMSGVPETLTAVWVAPKYSVTYGLGGGAGTLPTQSALESGGSFQVASGAGLSFEGHSFLGWSDGSVTYKAGDLYTVGSSDVALTALWSVNEAPIPDNVLPPGVDDSMIGEPTNVTLSGSTDTTLTLGSEGTNASVTVPAGALPEGTTLSVYPVLSSAGLADTFPSAHKFVVSMIVTWRAPDGSVPIAGVPVTMTITNPAIKAGDRVYQYFDGVLTFVGRAKKAGTITFTFTEDPVFTVSSPPVTDGGDGGSGGTGGDGSGISDGSGDSSDGIANVVDTTETASGVTLPYTGSTTSTPLAIALVLFTVGGAMVLGTRRKKTSLVRNDENELIS